MGCAEIISLIDVIITTVLTGVIIWQTYSLHKKQQELEERINNSQLEMQQKQLRLEIYNYRRTVYSHLIRVFDFCSRFQRLYDMFDEKDDMVQKFLLSFKVSCSDYSKWEFDFEEAINNAKHIFDNNLYLKIEEVFRSFEIVINIKEIAESDIKSGVNFVKYIVSESIKIIESINIQKDTILDMLDEELNVSH